MDSKSANCIDLNICCCCLKDSCYKDIGVEYYQYGEKEVYKDILKDTFDIQINYGISHNATSRILICDECILKLRGAYIFKKMVIHSIERFQKFLDELIFKEDIKSEVTYNENSVKDESMVESDLEVADAMDGFGNNEISDIKLTSAVKEKKMKSSNKKTGVREVRGCSGDKIKKNISDDFNASDKRTKICGRRRKARLLRENTLKLLANSSMCIFQWNKSRYRCFCCSEPFDNMNLLKEHTKTKHSLTDVERKIIKQQNLLVKAEISLLKCQICNDSVKDLDHLQKHLINAHDVNFVSLEHLFVPFKIQDGGLSCQICFENFNQFRVLNIHMNRHYQKHICDKCGAGFNSLMFLNLHKTRLHRELKCVKCNIDFKNKSGLKNHEIKIHDVKYIKKKRFPCPLCNERFFQEYLKVDHLVKRHGLVKPEFKCRFCSKSFITKSLVNNHTKFVHFKEKIHECNVCHNYFYTRTDLKRHKNIHTGKKVSCDNCSNLFASKESLRRHSKRCHSE